MRRVFAFIVSAFLLIAATGTARAVDVPAPKLVRLFDAGKRVGPSTGIEACERCASAAAFLKSELLKKTGYAFKGKGGGIIVKIVPETDVRGPEGYAISHKDGRVVLRAGSEAGALYGARTLVNTLEKDPQGFYFRKATVEDYPGIRIRALHLPLISDSSYMKEVITRAAVLKFNTVIIMADDMVVYRSHPELARPGAVPMETLNDIVAHSRSLGLNVVPEIQLLTHQKDLFKTAHPALMLNAHTYDPDKDEVYAIVFDLIDELADVFSPEYFHIGHDEVWGVHWATKPEVKDGDRILTHEAYARHINRVQEYLKRKNVKTIIWGDMFLHPSMFRRMSWKQLHGTDGFDKALGLISKEVVIADYHYYDTNDFSTMKYFQKKGFKVFGSTWDRKKNIFSSARYAGGLEEAPLGMIATTWFHMNRMEKTIIDDIIGWSAEAYWNPMSQWK
ncbi:MAG: family 20 glycosylhydrolase [Deltaproteobacteria bacterium]|nr:family 20 glycosylhydrolase [Deltaproteobacteria bacterium]